MARDAPSPLARSPESAGNVAISWMRDLLLVGSIASGGIAGAIGVLVGLPTTVSVFAAGSAAAGLLLLAIRPAYLHPHHAAAPQRDARATARPEPAFQSHFVPHLRTRTTNWPVVGVARSHAALRAEPSHPPPSLVPPGDAIWGPWESAAGELPSHLAGPAPETFVPMGPTLSAGIFDTGTPMFALPLLATSPPSVTSTLAPTPSDGEDMSFTDIELEALTPIPPHLRVVNSVPVLAPEAPGSVPTETRSSGRARCASCRRAVPEAPAWRRCPECHAVLCAPCSVAALKTQPRAWCALCAPLYAPS